MKEFFTSDTLWVIVMIGAMLLFLVFARKFIRNES